MNGQTHGGKGSTQRPADKRSLIRTLMQSLM